MTNWAVTVPDNTQDISSFDRINTTQPKEKTMKKTEQDTSKQVNQHKRMAMGEKVTGMKKGGMAACMKEGGKVKKEEKRDHKKEEKKKR